MPTLLLSSFFTYREPNKLWTLWFFHCCFFWTHLSVPLAVGFYALNWLTYWIHKTMTGIQWHFIKRGQTCDKAVLQRSGENPSGYCRCCKMIWGKCIICANSGHNNWGKYLPLTLLLTWTPLIFCYSTHITLISLCMAVLPSLRPPWLCLTFISAQIGDTTAAESGGFHTSILWASAWWALFTINKRIKPHWVWVQCSHSVRWEGRTVSISLFSPKFGNISWSSSV